ncbi:hypothetical protein MRX96_005329 [Rhipicephalus microplus]
MDPRKLALRCPSQQETIYNNCVRHIIDGRFEGYNAVVLTYGENGSEKTCTQVPHSAGDNLQQLCSAIFLMDVSKATTPSCLLTAKMDPRKLALRCPSQQETIYNNCVRHILDGRFEGYNAVVLTYGENGSEKTCTQVPLSAGDNLQQLCPPYS